MSDRQLIARYTVGERTTHWLVALSFILAALSGLALFHPALFWLSNLFGGGPWTRVLHPFIGLFMLVVFLFLAGAVWDDNRLQPADWKWLKHIRDVVNNREQQLPEVGRYNGAQKLLFLILVGCMVGLALSGPVIWREYFSGYFAVSVIRLAAVVHALCAFILVCAILLHIYAAIWVKGSVRAMVRGTVTPGWAWKNHRAWFRHITDAAHHRTGSD
jgi:formate dehydrogenase subunit gamma